MPDYDEMLKRLSRSSFRSRFHLSQKDSDYAERLGSDGLRRHALEIIGKRIAPASIPNDGRQTPMRGHPIFVAQHACACCCRGCLRKWYRVPENAELTVFQQKCIAELLARWIERELCRDADG